MASQTLNPQQSNPDPANIVVALVGIVLCILIRGYHYWKQEEPQRTIQQNDRLIGASWPGALREVTPIANLPTMRIREDGQGLTSEAAQGVGAPTYPLSTLETTPLPTHETTSEEPIFIFPLNPLTTSEKEKELIRQCLTVLVNKGVGKYEAIGQVFNLSKKSHNGTSKWLRARAWYEQIDGDIQQRTKDHTRAILEGIEDIK